MNYRLFLVKRVDMFTVTNLVVIDSNVKTMTQRVYNQDKAVDKVIGK